MIQRLQQQVNKLMHCNTGRLHSKVGEAVQIHLNIWHAFPVCVGDQACTLQHHKRKSYAVHAAVLSHCLRTEAHHREDRDGIRETSDMQTAGSPGWEKLQSAARATKSLRGPKNGSGATALGPK